MSSSCDVKAIRSLLDVVLGFRRATTARSLGDLGVFLQYSLPHQVHVAFHVIHKAREDVGRCVEINQKVRAACVPQTVLGDLVGQQSLSQVLQVSDHCAPLHQGLHCPPERCCGLGPLHGLHDEGKLVPRHGFKVNRTHRKVKECSSN